MKAISATGRRKTAVAQVRLTLGSGIITVNGRAFENFFPIDTHRMSVNRPFDATKNEGKFDVRAVIRGGGITGQAQALQLGIARALVELEPELRVILRAADLLTRDPRMVERKKYGQKKARKRFQFSKR
jgi:small subunit ribosomal protein S9